MKAERYNDGSCRFTIETVVPAVTEERDGITVEVTPAITVVESEWRFGAPPNAYKGTAAAWYAQCKREVLLLAAQPAPVRMTATEEVAV